MIMNLFSAQSVYLLHSRLVFLSGAFSRQNSRVLFASPSIDRFFTLRSRVLELCACIMSISWAKLCADAEAKSLQALLSGNYIFGGILVRFEFLCRAKSFARL
jgi:hypothetical protein